MLLDDDLLPAVRELTGPAAHGVVGAAIGAAGGELGSLRCSEVHWVPGSELVVRYRADVTWPQGRTPNDTILAATTRHGHLPGTLPIEADHETGRLQVSVWRWPFDPLVVGLPTAVTPSALAPLVEGLLGPIARVQVVAYRPTQRAVVRVRDGAGRVAYVKALRPSGTEALSARHALCRKVGLPVPAVVRCDLQQGLMVLEELPGTTLRERIKQRQRPWPCPDAIVDLLGRFRAITDMARPPKPSRLHDAVAHARLLATVAPHHRAMLDSLVGSFADAIPDAEARSTEVIHGDLHEGQLVVDDHGSITGVLDLDDLSLGDPVDDAATMLGHLRYRSVATEDAASSNEIDAYVTQLRSALVEVHEPAILDRSTAAVLVGLATGPFRIQMQGWRALTDAIVGVASDLVPMPARRG